MILGYRGPRVVPRWGVAWNSDQRRSASGSPPGPTPTPRRWRRPPSSSAVSCSTSTSSRSSSRRRGSRRRAPRGSSWRRSARWWSRWPSRTCSAGSSPWSGPGLPASRGAASSWSSTPRRSRRCCATRRSVASRCARCSTSPRTRSTRRWRSSSPTAGRTTCCCCTSPATASRSTAVAAEFVNRRMGRSRSRRVVLLLDCCYAGAFERGMTARAGSGVGIEDHFGGRGRAVITASSAMEYAFEGDELTDTKALAPSVFTSALVEGLRTGDADRDQDGYIALDELYDYVYDKVREATPNQTPGKWTFGVQGELVIARRGRPVTTPAPLPAELQQAVVHPLASVRAAAVQELAPILHGQHAGLALAARLTLERLTNDDSRRVAAAAKQALAAEAPQPVMGEVPAVAEVRAAEEAPSQAAAESAPAPLPVAQAAATASPPEAPAGGPEQ